MRKYAFFLPTFFFFFKNYIPSENQKIVQQTPIFIFSTQIQHFLKAYHMYFVSVRVYVYIVP